MPSSGWMMSSSSTPRRLSAVRLGARSYSCRGHWHRNRGGQKAAAEGARRARASERSRLATGVSSGNTTKQMGGLRRRLSWCKALLDRRASCAVGPRPEAGFHPGNEATTTCGGRTEPVINPAGGGWGECNRTHITVNLFFLQIVIAAAVYCRPVPMPRQRETAQSEWGAFFLPSQSLSKRVSATKTGASDAPNPSDSTHLKG